MDLITHLPAVCVQVLPHTQLCLSLLHYFLLRLTVCLTCVGAVARAGAPVIVLRPQRPFVAAEAQIHHSLCRCTQRQARSRAPLLFQDSQRLTVATRLQAGETVSVQLQSVVKRLGGCCFFSCCFCLHAAHLVGDERSLRWEVETAA